MLAMCFGSLSCCMMKLPLQRSMHFSVNCKTECFCGSLNLFFSCHHNCNYMSFSMLSFAILLLINRWWIRNHVNVLDTIYPKVLFIFAPPLEATVMLQPVGQSEKVASAYSFNILVKDAVGKLAFTFFSFHMMSFYFLNQKRLLKCIVYNAHCPLANLLYNSTFSN